MVVSGLPKPNAGRHIVEICTMATCPGFLTKHTNDTTVLALAFVLRKIQRCDLETMVSRLECTRVHFVQVSRPDGPGLGLGLET